MDPVAHLNAALAGHYEILREAGSGGMATVYVARDLKHERQVAIKVLKPDLAATIGADRFLQEVRIAAQLQHPHILPVFDSGDANGMLWYAMPFVEGESLRDKLTRDGALPINEALTFIREIAGALGKAHAAGVVHRDIKPENILVSDGHALVADFGVAKALTAAQSASSRGLTSAGVSLGTPGYMAPEQVAADPNADHRTDIYSLGIVSWELLVGHAPFSHLPPAQQLAAHISTIPDRVTALRADCPPALADAIAQCLAKTANERPQTADALRALLDGASGAFLPLTGERAGAQPARSSWQPMIAAAALVLVAVAGVFYMKGRSGGAPAGPSLAVLPFENLQGDSAAAYFSDGISEEIIGTVSRLPGLHVASRSVSFRHRGRDIDLKRVGSELGVTHLLEGSVQQSGKRVRVNVQLAVASTGTIAWSEKYDGDLTDVFKVEDEIATAVAKALNIQFGGAAAVGSATAGSTRNADAHDAYLLGLAARNTRDVKKAAEQFAKAIKLDSTYASAYSGLASALVLFPEYGATTKPDSAIDASRAAAKRALKLDATQVGAHLALAYAAKVHGRDFAGAEAEYKKALALDQNDAQAHHWYGELLMELRKFDEAAAEFTTSVKLDPTAPASTAMLAMATFRQAKTSRGPGTDSALALCRRTEEISPPGGVFPFEIACGMSLTRYHRYDDAKPYLVRAGRALGDSTLFIRFQAGLVGPGDTRPQSIAAVDAEMKSGKVVDPIVAAKWYLLLGENEKSIAALEGAERMRSPFVSFLEVLDFSALPESPRVAAVRKRLGY